MERLSRVALALVVSMAILVPSTAFAQKGVTWNWVGDWGPVAQGWKCPSFCIQHSVDILRPGKSPVRDDIILVDMNNGGAVFQFIVMGRQYSWHKATRFVAFAGTVDLSGGTRAEANAARIHTGLGEHLGLAKNQYDAAAMVMDDVAADFRRWEAEQTSKSGGSSGGSGTDPDREARIAKMNDRKEFDAFFLKEQAKALARAEADIARKDLKAALLGVRLALVVAKTPAAIEMEQRVLRLIDEETAARKAVGIVDDPLTGERIEPAPDRKTLFAGNPGYKPYPNPYDTPDPARSIREDPCVWKDHLRSVDDVAFLKKELKAARKAHDGYRILQIACRRSDRGPDFAPLGALLEEVARIARFNRDPWLMMGLAMRYRGMCMGRTEDRYPLRFLPAHFYREAYRLAVLRGDPAPLEFLWERQRNSDVIPELNARQILDKAKEMKKRGR